MPDVVISPLSSSRFNWTIDGPDLVTVQSWTYKHYDDGKTVGEAFTGVVCDGLVTPFHCSVAVPAYTPGTHTIQISASSADVESAKSDIFSFKMAIVPGVPKNISITIV